jgi:hypothetical protein
VLKRRDVCSSDRLYNLVRQRSICAAIFSAMAPQSPAAAQAICANQKHQQNQHRTAANAFSVRRNAKK